MCLGAYISDAECKRRSQASPRQQRKTVQRRLDTRRFQGPATQSKADFQCQAEILKNEGCEPVAAPCQTDVFDAPKSPCASCEFGRALSDASTSASSDGDAAEMLSEDDGLELELDGKPQKKVTFGNVETFEIEIDGFDPQAVARVSGLYARGSRRLLKRQLGAFEGATPRSSKPVGCVDQFLMGCACLVGVLGFKVGLTPFAVMLAGTVKAKQTVQDLKRSPEGRAR